MRPNVDLKGFTDDFYKWVKGNLQSTLNFIETVFKNNIHVEITNLIIPQKLTMKLRLEKCDKWIGSLSKTYHFIYLDISNYRLDIPQTPADTLKNFYNIAKDHLNFVYVGNIFINGTNTTNCPNCNTLLIDRQGYSTKVLIIDSKCPKCGNHLNIQL